MLQNASLAGALPNPARELRMPILKINNKELKK